MKKIVVINSTGPMGSSVVCSVVEKFGYLSIPLRDLGLHDYLVGKKTIADRAYFEQRFLEASRLLKGTIRSGGINVPDRDTSAPRAIIDLEFIENGLRQFHGQAFAGIAELYARYRELFAAAVVYKKIQKVSGHVQLSIDFHKYDVHQLIQGYQQAFDKAYFIHLHRGFTDWMESMASQRFANPRKRRSYAYHALYRRYDEYESRIHGCPGLHVDFEDIFLPNTRNLISQIADYLAEPVPQIDWENERFDLFGNLREYREVFTKADIPGTYLSRMTRGLIDYCFSRKCPGQRWCNALVYPAYCLDLIRYLRQKKAFAKQK